MSIAAGLVLLGWIGTVGYAQPGQPVQQLTTGFERDVNRYRWTSDLVVLRQMGVWEVDVANRFLSEAFILNEQVSEFRDEERGDWRVYRRLGSRLAGGFQGRFSWFSLSNALTQDAYAAARWSPRPYAWFEPAAGVAIDRRPGAVRPDGTVPFRMDQGPALGLRFEVTPPPVDEYRLMFRGSGTWQFINPRRGRAVQTLASVARTFNKTDVTVEAGYANVRRDAYQAASFLNRTEPIERGLETTEATVADTLVATVRVLRPVRSNWQLNGRLNVSSNSRAIRTLQAPDDALYFDTDFNRRELDAEVGIGYDRGAASGRLFVHGGATVERRQLTNRSDLPPAQAALKGDLLRQADFDGGFLTLRAQWQATPLRRLSVNLNGSANILRRDTPEENFDDRDEVFHNAQFGLLMRLSRYVELDVNVFGTFFHTVYLQALRSGENNRQRALRLRPAVQWTPSRRTRIRLLAELRATYTVDDFDIEGQPRNDQSARERRYEGTIDHQLGATTRLLVEGRIGDLHLGRLLWDEFAEIPFDTLRTYSGWARLQVGRRWTAELGIRAFVRRDFDRRTAVRYPRVDDAGAVLRSAEGEPLTDTITRLGREWIEQIGPTCAVEWPMAKGSTLRFDGWVQVQRIRQRLFGDLPPEAAERIRDAARRGTRRFVPNLSMTILWNF